MEEAINFFEESSDNFHLIYDKMEQLLQNQLSKVIKDSALQEVDEEGNIKKISGINLIDFDFDNKEALRSFKTVKIGEECSEFMRKLDLSPSSAQVKTFMESAQKFHISVAKSFIKYFESGLNSTVLKYCSGFSPKNHSKFNTKKRIVFLAKRYKRIISNIERFDGLDSLERELDEYVSDKELIEYEDLNYSEYWAKVRQIKENGWVKYEILPRFALAMSTILNSNSECERMFSKQTRLSRDPDRNKMSQKMFESHLIIASGAERKECIENCDKCKKVEQRIEIGLDNNTTHCHCSIAPIPESMKALSRVSWKKNATQLKDKAEQRTVEKSLLVARKRKFDEKVENEITSLKDKISKRNTLLPPNKMLRIWGESKGAKAQDKKQK